MDAASEEAYRPRRRYGHSCLAWKDQLYVWSGRMSTLPEVHSNPKKVEIASFVDVLELKNWKWKQLTTTGNPPPGLFSYACTAVESDFYYFGGNCGHPNCFHNALHKLDATSLDWSELAAGSPREGPMKKEECGMACLRWRDHDVLMVVGGFGLLPAVQQPGSRYTKFALSRGTTNEIHLYILKKGAPSRWTSWEMVGDRPPPCRSFTLTSVSKTKAVMYGGYATLERQHSSDIYIAEILDDRRMIHWASVPSPLDPDNVWPDRRCYHTAVSSSEVFPDTNILVFVGGKSLIKNITGDCWMFDLNTKQWKRLPIPSVITKRYHHSASVISIHPDYALIIIFGGKNEQHQYIDSDTYIIKMERDEKGEWCWGFMLLQEDGPEPFLHTYVPPSERKLSRNSSVLPYVTYSQEDMTIPVQIGSGTHLSEPVFGVCAEAVFTINADTIENLEWPGYGFLMDVSDASLASEDAVKLSIRAILDGQFDLPPHCHLVSAMYWLVASTTIDGASVYIQHCAKVSSSVDESPQLQLAVMSPFESSPLVQKFELVRGTITPHQQYASFKLPEFRSCLVAAVVSSPASTPGQLPQSLYTGSAFLKLCNDSEVMVDFAITKQLDCYSQELQRQYKGWHNIHKEPVEFKEKIISLDFSDSEADSSASDADGWRIHSLTHLDLPKEDVDALQLHLPVCHIGLTWEGRTAPNTKLLNQPVHLLGAKSLHANFIIRCPDIKANDEDKEEKEPTLDHFIKKVAKKIPHKWRVVGSSLGISRDLLDTIEEKHAGLGKLGSFVEVFSYWRRQSKVPFTWKALAASLENSPVNEQELAQQVRADLMTT